jgi:anti-anti-sigma factor
MQVQCHRDGEIDRALVVAPGGSLNIATEDDFWLAVSNALDEDTPSLMVDMSQVELITSSGVGIMVRAFHRSTRLGGKMAVFAANARVLEVIEAVMLTQILGVCDTIEDAREHVR